jgi:hypothetical protein
VPELIHRRLRYGDRVSAERYVRFARGLHDDPTLASLMPGELMQAIDKVSSRIDQAVESPPSAVHFRTGA